MTDMPDGMNLKRRLNPQITQISADFHKSKTSSADDPVRRLLGLYGTFHAKVDGLPAVSRMLKTHFGKGRCRANSSEPRGLRAADRASVSARLELAQGDDPGVRHRMRAAEEPQIGRRIRLIQCRQQFELDPDLLGTPQGEREYFRGLPRDAGKQLRSRLRQPDEVT